MKSFLLCLLGLFLGWIQFWIHCWVHIAAAITAVIQISTALKRKPTQSSSVGPKMLRNRHNLPLQKPCHVQRLPNEVLMVVFEMVGTGGRKADLLNCTLVSKLWHDLVTPVLWRAPIPTQPICCLPPFTSQLSRSQKWHSQESTVHRVSGGFPIHLPKYGHAIRSLTLSSSALHLTDCSIRHIVKYCPNLVSLQMANCKHLTNDSLRSLSRAQCAPHLRVLNLQNCVQLSDTGLTHLAAECSSLEIIQLGGCVRISHQGVTHLVKASSRTLRRLCLSDCGRVTGATIHQIAKLCRTRLEWLDIARIGAVQHADLVALVGYCPNLTRLNLARPKSMLLRQLQQHRQEQRRQQHRQRHQDHDDDYIPLLESQVNPLDELIDMLRRYNVQPAISSLFAHNQRFEQQYQQLAKQDDVSDATLELIITQLPRLAHLDLSHWTCLTDGAICVLAKHGLALTHLNLSGCKNITYRVFGYLSGLCHRNEKLTNITLGDFVPLHEPTSSSSSSTVSSAFTVSSATSVSSIQSSWRQS
ncbi:hypothetical protein CLU79DRAFT_776971 [Phycomyces nitens]|nr:hypothetical protein CLU79DRAFT_776971 [Phycomyces nitens]